MFFVHYTKRKPSLNHKIPFFTVNFNYMSVKCFSFHSCTKLLIICFCCVNLLQQQLTMKFRSLLRKALLFRDQVHMRSDKSCILIGEKGRQLFRVATVFTQRKEPVSSPRDRVTESEQDKFHVG